MYQTTHNKIVSFNWGVHRLEREIELLREYRTRLVADVVTGKLDLRPAARQLPAEAELEPADVSEEMPDEAGLSEVEK